MLGLGWGQGYKVGEADPLLLPELTLRVGAHREQTRASGSCRNQTGSKPREGGQEELSERGVWAANRANRRVDRATSRGMNLAPPRTEMRPLC